MHRLHRWLITVSLMLALIVGAVLATGSTEAHNGHDPNSRMHDHGWSCQYSSYYGYYSWVHTYIRHDWHWNYPYTTGYWYDNYNVMSRTWTGGWCDPGIS
jgi:hypothetical protein